MSFFAMDHDSPTSRTPSGDPVYNSAKPMIDRRRIEALRNMIKDKSYIDAAVNRIAQTLTNEIVEKGGAR